MALIFNPGQRTLKLFRLLLSAILGTLCHPQANLLGQNLEVFHAFDYPEGGRPKGGLVVGNDGFFYGTTFTGGTNGGFGTVFKVAGDSELVSLHSFDGADGAEPIGRLVQGTDGDFYGTTHGGGLFDRGTVFKMGADGNFKSLHSFYFEVGEDLYGGLVQGEDGEFYGTTSGGGSGYGTIFRITSEGVFSTLLSLEMDDPRGSHPEAGLTLANDGYFYGTAVGGGEHRIFGTVFRLSTNGTVTAVHSFDGNQGFSPRSRVMQARDGNLYGMAQGGILYRLSLAGEFQVLADLGNSSLPIDASLVQDKVGNLFGVTYGWPPDDDDGTFFKFAPNGAVTSFLTLLSPPFRSPNTPSGGMIAGVDGNYYGTIERGGVNGWGVLYRLNMPILSVTAGETDTVVSWSEKVTGFSLQVKESLATNSLWLDVTNEPVLLNGSNTVVVPTLSDEQFFQLRK